MIINKYYLYFTVLLIVCLLTMGGNLYRLLTYKRTEGIIVGHAEEFVPTSTGGYTKKYPEILFKTDKYEVRFYGPSIAYEQVYKNGIVDVLYDEDKPEKAFINSGLGLFGPALIWVLPFFLIWTICIFSVGWLPKRIDLGKIEKKLFG